MTRKKDKGSKARQTISAECSLYVDSSSPFDVFHSFAVLSKEPVAILSPYGRLKDRQYTAFLCPFKVCSRLPVCVFHTLQV